MLPQTPVLDLELQLQLQLELEATTTMDKLVHVDLLLIREVKNSLGWRLFYRLRCCSL